MRRGGGRGGEKERRGEEVGNKERERGRSGHLTDKELRGGVGRGDGGRE